MGDDTSNLESDLDRLCAALRNTPDEAIQDRLLDAIEGIAERMCAAGAVEEPPPKPKRKIAD